MLGKLIKHEWKATARILLPVNIAIIILTIIGKIGIHFSVFRDTIPALYNISVALYVLAICLATVVSLLYLASRFYKNYFTDEGYLAFTLPVNSSQLILSKLIVFIIWTLIEIVVIIGSICILFIGERFWIESWQLIKEAWPSVVAEFETLFNISFNTFWIYMLILCIVGILSQPLQIYASIAIGHTMGKHKIVASIAVYLIINTATSIISTIISLPFGLQSAANFANSSAMVTDLSFFNILYPVTIVETIILLFVFFFITKYFMDKKLNLD